MFSDESKTAKGLALYKIQNGTSKLILYTGGRLPSAVENYSITKSKLLGLCINTSQLTPLLAKVDFDHTVDYIVLTFLMKSKTDPASARINTVRSP